MNPENRQVLEALLHQMHAIHGELNSLHAGICILHMDASIAALESHLSRGGKTYREAMLADLGRSDDNGGVAIKG